MRPLFTDEAQKLHIRFRIDPTGKAESILFTDRTKATSQSKAAIQHIISSVTFPPPPNDVSDNWFELPLTIEARLTDESANPESTRDR